ncbi:MAG: cupin domain-containing protein [Peptococcaceae bacterium]
MEVIKKGRYVQEVLNNAGPLHLLVSAKESGARNCQAGMAVLAPGQRLPAAGYSRHPSEEISYIVSGTVKVHTDSGWEIAEEGDLVFMPENKPHFNENIAKSQAQILWFVTPITVKEN